MILAQQRLARPQGSRFLFPSPLGKSWNKDNFNHRVFRPAVDASGFSALKLTFHDLRHTFAALMVAADVHPKTLQVLMGHKDIRVTMDTYGHLYEGAGAAAMDLLDRFQ
jgi:integrase